MEDIFDKARVLFHLEVKYKACKIQREKMLPGEISEIVS